MTKKLEDSGRKSKEIEILMYILLEYVENILYFSYIPYLVGIVIFFIYGLIVIL
jgi:hypothetical protein